MKIDWNSVVWVYFPRIVASHGALAEKAQDYRGVAGQEGGWFVMMGVCVGDDAGGQGEKSRRQWAGNGHMTFVWERTGKGKGTVLGKTLFPSFDPGRQLVWALCARGWRGRLSGGGRAVHWLA